MYNKSDVELLQLMQETYEGKTLSELIDAIDGLLEEEKSQEARLLKESIAVNLGLVEASEFNKVSTKLCDLVEFTEGLEERLSELEENFRRHRHDCSKSYSEKPSW